MTKIPSILLFVLFYFTAKAQTNVYHPFQEANASWNFNKTYYCYIPPAGTSITLTTSYSITISGDTIINGLTYHKLIIPKLDQSCYNTHSVYYNQYQGAIRQDIAQKKVFLWRGFSQEELLYDFNLKVGDTLRGVLEASPTNCKNKVLKIDSVIVGTGYRKMWVCGMGNIGSNYNKFSIIEGIGSTYGLILAYLINCVGHFDDYNLVCYNENGNVLYPASSGSSCQLITSINESSIEKEIIPYPNPVEDILTIQIPSGISEAYVRIYDLMGKIIVFQKINAGILTLSIDHLQKGLYFAEVAINNNKQLVKVMKN